MPTRHIVPQWVKVAVPLVVCGGVLFCAVFYWPCITRPRVQWRHALPETLEGGRQPLDRRVFEDRFPGHSEAAIAARFGEPAERLGSGNGPFEFDRRAYPEARVVRYAGVRGALFLAYCHQRGRWVCFRAHWQPDPPNG